RFVASRLHLRLDGGEISTVAPPRIAHRHTTEPPIVCRDSNRPVVVCGHDDMEATRVGNRIDSLALYNLCPFRYHCLQNRLVPWIAGEEGFVREQQNRSL